MEKLLCDDRLWTVEEIKEANREAWLSYVERCRYADTLYTDKVTCLNFEIQKVLSILCVSGKSITEGIKE